MTSDVTLRRQTYPLIEGETEECSPLEQGMAFFTRKPL
jgi:hypothetical protein